MSAACVRIALATLPTWSAITAASRPPSASARLTRLASRESCRDRAAIARPVSAMWRRAQQDTTIAT
ncbi:MAG TPA: hypothetical protein VHZ03_55045 [Trebonia sp.]|jgi:hypothetical protein|nr:hypothetical protein [Trebonia sp.]